MRRARTALVVIGVAAGLGLAAAVLETRDSRYTLPASAERLLYLRSGRVARALALSFDAIAADVYWMRTIQHYGGDRHSARTRSRFELLQPLLDLTTALDPHFVIAYRFGAIFLAEPYPNGPGRTDQAIALLQKGLAVDPARWQYAHDAGFVYYWYVMDYKAAAGWFARASALPGAPIWLRPLAATTLAGGGDRVGARQLLGELAKSEEKWVRETAERRLLQLRAMDEIDALQARLDRHGSLPAAVLDPAGLPYVIDPATHRIGLDPRSPLSPLPRNLTR